MASISSSQIVVVVAGVLTVLVSAESLQAQPMARKTPPQRSDRTRAITASPREVLAKRIARVDWDETPLTEVFEWYRGQGFENVLPAWRALRVEGIDPRTPVTLTMRNVTVSDILSETMNQLSEETRWRAVGLTLHISTRRDFADDLYTRVYRLGEEVHDTPDFLHNVCGKPERSTYTREQHLERIRDLITESIATESWRRNGGKGTIDTDPTSVALIIRNTPEVHVLIGGSFDLSEAVPSPTRPAVLPAARVGAPRPVSH